MSKNKPIHIPVLILYVTLDLYQANQGNAAKKSYELALSWSFFLSIDFLQS